MTHPKQSCTFNYSKIGINTKENHAKTVRFNHIASMESAHILADIMEGNGGATDDSVRIIKGFII